MKSSWEYVHAALTGPTLPSNVTHGIHSRTHIYLFSKLSLFIWLGYFSDATDESGKLLLWKEGQQTPIEKVKLVPLLTVDTYCKQNGISTVDILKIVYPFQSKYVVIMYYNKIILYSIRTLRRMIIK